MKSYTDMLAAYGVSIARPGGKAITNYVLNQFPMKENGNVLEVGCGLGDTSYIITNKFNVSLTSIDSHIKMLEKAMKRHETAKKITWIHTDLMSFQPSSLFSDCIIESVLSFTDVRKSLKRLYHLLNKQGRLYLLEPIYLGGLTDEELRSYKQFYGFQSLLTKEKWLETLKNNRFTVKEIITSTDIISEIYSTNPFPELIMDNHIDAEYLNILNQHLELNDSYLAFFDYAYFICEKA